MIQLCSPIHDLLCEQWLVTQPHTLAAEDYANWSVLSARMKGFFRTVTHVGSRAVLRHKGHSEMGAEQSSRQPAPSFFRREFLPHENGSLEDALP